jgi:hypothetical protein
MPNQGGMAGFQDIHFPQTALWLFRKPIVTAGMSRCAAPDDVAVRCT